MNTKNICAICAYRATCRKKFSISGKDINCPDFAKDVSIREDAEEADKEDSEK
ncbi:hypothetical protein BMS3Abin07_02629 [bacterium BMS3Abin07]|nr:hypothetical protein BMS3Abin07_02629 [bacterium BMS3Abin07]GBE31699.1 hypothetical protein BMS3Bbin05_00602 [bacterium BMS3Bbin05]